MTRNLSPGPRPAPDLSAGREWLEQFPPRRRGPLANWFCQAVRAGCNTPRDVLAAVSMTLKARLNSRWSDAEDREFFRGALEAIHGEERPAALEYARAVLRWEALPRAERERIKNERGETHRQAWMENQEPTEKQVSYLAALGYRGDRPANRREASELIDNLKRREGVP